MTRKLPIYRKISCHIQRRKKEVRKDEKIL